MSVVVNSHGGAGDGSSSANVELYATSRVLLGANGCCDLSSQRYPSKSVLPANNAKVV